MTIKKGILASVLNYRYIVPLLLFLLFLIALSLRVYLIDKNLFFGPEQGRDLLVVKEIALNHKLVLIGPKTSVDGVFHGPLYYYVGVIPFLISNGNPLFISVFFITINCLSVFFIYLLGKEMFDRRVGIIASLIFTFSFGLITMSRWLSHPPLIIPLSCLFLLFFAKFLKGKNIYLVFSALIFGLSSQVASSNLLLVGFFSALIFFIYWKKFIKQKLSILLFSLGIAITISIGNFILFDLRHNFILFDNITKLSSKNLGYYGTFLNSFVSSATNFINIFTDSVFPEQPIFAFVLLILGIFILLRSQRSNMVSVLLLLIWLLIPFIAFVALKYNPLYHYFAAVMTAGIVLVSVLINKVLLFKKSIGISIIIVLLLFNLYSWIRYLPTNKNAVFQAAQPDLRYSDQVRVINEIYKRAQGKEFYYQSYTIPYWFQDGWEYLFWYYGENKYGYVPVDKKAKNLFVVIQDDLSNKQFQGDWLENTVSKWGEKTEEFRFGALKVQKINVK